MHAPVMAVSFTTRHGCGGCRHRERGRGGEVVNSAWGQDFTRWEQFSIDKGDFWLCVMLGSRATIVPMGLFVAFVGEVWLRRCGWGSQGWERSGEAGDERHLEF